jgi:hypothetical protein
MAWDRFWRWYDWGARLEFGGNLLGLVFDWKTWLATFFGVGGGGLLTFLWAAIDGWSPLNVWLASLFAAAAGTTFVYFLLTIIEKRKNSPKVRTEAQAPAQPAVKPEPDIEAREAFFKILDHSEWSSQQDRITTDTTHLVYDWKEVRLSGELHKALRNSRLNSWGEECLEGTATTPEKPIPSETWDRIEIVFDRNSALHRTTARFKGRTSLEMGRMAWVGVKFSRQQIFNLFPLSETPTVDRIPVKELLRIAADLGWSFSSDSLHLIDMQDAIRQGGRDGTLTVWGRVQKWTDERLARNELLEKIPTTHWSEFFVSLYMGLNDDNFHTKSWHPDQKKKGFVDLHVQRSEATVWLKRDAAPFKGRTSPR